MLGFKVEVNNARWINDQDYIVLEVQESHDYTNQNYSNSIGTLYTFNDNFNLLSISSTNMYDRHARELNISCRVEFLANGGIWRRLKILCFGGNGNL